MGRGQSGVAAKIDFDLWREPAKSKTVVLFPQESGFGKVHLGPDLLHPGVGSLVRQDADSSRVTSEGQVGEGIDVEERDGHGSTPGKRRFRMLSPRASPSA